MPSCFSRIVLILHNSFKLTISLTGHTSICCCTKNSSSSISSFLRISSISSSGCFLVWWITQLYIIYLFLKYKSSSFCISSICFPLASSYYLYLDSKVALIQLKSVSILANLLWISIDSILSILLSILSHLLFILAHIIHKNTNHTMIFQIVSGRLK